MIRKFLIITAALLLNVCMTMASDFDFIFSDSTLRIDYIFSGNADAQMISVKEIKKSPHWAGRRTNLQTVPLDGNGDITIYDASTNDVLYKNSFSSLFQEWLSTPEAMETNRSFEFTLLVPKPHSKVVAEVVLRNNKNQATATFRHTIMPNDVLIKDMTAQKPEPYKYLHKAGNPNECIDIAIVAEGYTKKEMKHFLKDAQTAADEILSYEPFSRYADKINFVAVMCPSIDTDVTTPQDNSWKQTAINSNFMTFYSPRYLTTNSIHTLHDRLANIPYEHIIVLANTYTYGGGGIYNSLTLTTTHHESFKPVVVHEFGHSFGGLADEYFYDSGDVLDATYSLNHEP
ncbi:MAG: peptidase M64, partial [Bacteroidaceae bacterium]|nr:peptidase M64 [Bacteroidaceae bacterium]